MSVNPVDSQGVSKSAQALVDAVSQEYLARAEEEKKEIEALKGSLKTYGKDTSKLLKNSLVYSILAIAAGVLVLSLISCVNAFVYTDHSRLFSIYIIEGMVVLLMVMIVISSAWPYWNYHNRKKMFIVLITALAGAFFLEVLYKFISAFVVPLLLLPEPNKWVTESKWMFLIRSVTIVPSLVGTVFFVQWFWLFAFDRFVFQDICSFRILNHVDMRKNKKYCYDAIVVRKLSNGRKWVIRETDRYMHWMVNGGTGTGKTSSQLIPMINGDLKKRCQNEDMQKKLMYEACKNGLVKMRRLVTDGNFSLDAFVPAEGREKEAMEYIKNVAKKYRKCGITAIGPDDSLSDVVFQLCEGKNIKCNRVDPITDKNTDGKDKKGFIGFNPLYISPRIPAYKRNQEIVKRATLFADVMQAINEMKGKGDPYFTSINRSMTVAFSICLCVTMPLLDGRQPTPADVQEVVNDFKRIDEDGHSYYKKLLDVNDELGDDNVYGFVIDFISYDILGKGAEKMMEQSRGLRMLMNEFLTNPLIRRTLCADEAHTIDMDKMLEEGQITAVNYALELGETDSKGFGLFFLLSFIDAVFRRDSAEGANTIPHFLIIDELPVIIHPQFERAISLFRKYKVSIVGCIQSLDQMEKNESTRYLRDVLMGGCATHTVYGRCGANEMKRYSELAGKKYEVTVQESQSETSITNEDPNLSYSTRESIQQQDALDASSIRNRAFQEVTMFTVVNGNLVPPFYGKVDFLDATEKNWLKRPTFKWEEFYKDIPPVQASVDESDVQGVKKLLKENSASVPVDDDDDDDLSFFFTSKSKITIGSSGDKEDESDYVAEEGAKNNDGSDIRSTVFEDTIKFNKENRTRKKQAGGDKENEDSSVSF